MKHSVRILALLFVLCLFTTTALADIEPAHGHGMIGYEAVVLSERLTVRQSADTRARSVRRLSFGDTFIVSSEVDGWCDCFLSETGGPVGYVLSDYIAIDPMYFIADESTVVYAWDSVYAKKVAMVGTGTRMPILMERGGWLLVSLRGASGWIHMNREDLNLYRSLNGQY